MESCIVLFKLSSYDLCVYLLVKYVETSFENDEMQRVLVDLRAEFVKILVESFFKFYPVHCRSFFKSVLILIFTEQILAVDFCL